VFGQNVFYNSGFVNETGYPSVLFYMFDGSFEVRTSGSDCVGCGISPSARFIIFNNGSLALGGSMDGTQDITQSAMFITTGKKIGIGTTTPSYNLDVVGDINYTGNLYQNGILVSSASQQLATNQFQQNLFNGFILLAISAWFWISTFKYKQ